MNLDYFYGLKENFTFHIQDFGHETSGVINDELFNKISTTRNKEYTIFSLNDFGFDMFDLVNENPKQKYYDSIFFVEIEEGIQTFKQKENILNDLIKEFKSGINEYIYEKIREIISKDNYEHIEIHNLVNDVKNKVTLSIQKVVFLSKSIKKSLLNEEILNHIDKRINIDTFKSEFKKSIQKYIKNFKNSLLEYLQGKKDCGDIYNIISGINLSEIKSIRLPNLGIELIYDFYTVDFTPKPQMIEVLSRTFVSGAKKANDPEMSGNVYSAKLFDLVELYDSKGKNLFIKNIRLGIENLMGVDTAITETLDHNPKEFWYLNNGVTMLVSKNSVQKDFDDSLLIDDYKKVDPNLGITVINGAQTINSATKFFVKSELYPAINNYVSEKFPDKLKEYTDESDIKISKINNAKDEAFVMLKVVELDTTIENQNIEKKINAITVSLNRQKPVGPVDLAYTLPVISELNRYGSEINENEELCRFVFTIVRRGDASSINNQRYTLNVLPRIMYAILLDFPGKAMSIGIKTLLTLNSESSHFKNNKLFPINNQSEEDSSITDPDNIYIGEELFKSKYKFINFAMKLYEELDLMQLSYEFTLSKDAKTPPYIKKFNSYSKYLLIYIIVNSVLEDYKKGDFSNWQLDASDVGKVINQNVYENLIKFLYGKWEELFTEELLEKDGISKGDIWQINNFKKDKYIKDLLPIVREDVRRILTDVKANQDQQVVNEDQELSPSTPKEFAMNG